MTTTPKRILILYALVEPLNQYQLSVQHHVRALEASDTPHQIIYFNAIDMAPVWLRYLDFDAVILHNTLLGFRWSRQPMSGWMRSRIRWIADLDCVRIAMPQDEYTYAHMLDEWLHELNVQVICSNFDATRHALLYPVMHTQATMLHTYTGYIDQQIPLSHIRPIKDRPKDLVYRAANRQPYWYGSQGQLKTRIGDILAEPARARGLICDVSGQREDRIFGNAWIDFLASGKTITGCESGSGVLDSRGEIRRRIETLLAADPDLSFEQVSAQMPPGWDSYGLFAISPRHFEAVLTKTCQVLVEGHYDGVLQPDIHYIPIKRDLSNLDEVVDKMCDHQLLQRIADRAYEDIYLSGKYTYRILANILENAIQTHQRPGKRPTADGIAWRIGAPLARRLSDLSLTTFNFKWKMYQSLKSILRRIQHQTDSALSS